MEEVHFEIVFFFLYWKSLQLLKIYLSFFFFFFKVFHIFELFQGNFSGCQILWIKKKSWRRTFRSKIQMFKLFYAVFSFFWKNKSIFGVDLYFSSFLTIEICDYFTYNSL